nr:uncharacterized protein LOC129381083 [Dermacentor andersoni]
MAEQLLTTKLEKPKERTLVLLPISTDPRSITFVAGKCEGAHHWEQPAVVESVARQQASGDTGDEPSTGPLPSTSNPRLSVARWTVVVERCVVASAAALVVIIFVFGFGSFGDHSGDGRRHSPANLPAASGSNQGLRAARVARDELSLLRNWSFVLTFWHEDKNNGTPANDSAFLAAGDSEYDEAKGGISVNITVDGRS